MACLHQSLNGKINQTKWHIAANQVLRAGFLPGGVALYIMYLFGYNIPPETPFGYFRKINILQTEGSSMPPSWYQTSCTK